MPPPFPFLEWSKLMAFGNIFDPVKYSIKENEYLREVLGQPTIVALRSKPADVNVAAVRPVLERIQELVDLEKHANLEWCGVDALKKSITIYLEQAEKWSLDKRRGRPRYPSMHTFDSRGVAHRSGPGSDQGQVRTYFEGDKRIKFEVQLIADNVEEYRPEWFEADKPKNGLILDKDKNRIECSVCGHTETYRPDSRGSYNVARGRMSKHLRNAKDEVQAHREIHTNEFGS